MQPPSLSHAEGEPRAEDAAVLVLEEREQGFVVRGRLEPLLVDPPPVGGPELGLCSAVRCIVLLPAAVLQRRRDDLSVVILGPRPSGMEQH